MDESIADGLEISGRLGPTVKVQASAGLATQDYSIVTNYFEVHREILERSQYGYETSKLLADVFARLGSAAEAWGKAVARAASEIVPHARLRVESDEGGRPASAFDGIIEDLAGYLTALAADVERTALGHRSASREFGDLYKALSKRQKDLVKESRETMKELVSVEAALTERKREYDERSRTAETDENAVVRAAAGPSLDSAKAVERARKSEARKRQAEVDYVNAIQAFNLLQGDIMMQSIKQRAELVCELETVRRHVSAGVLARLALSLTNDAPLLTARARFKTAVDEMGDVAPDIERFGYPLRAAASLAPPVALFRPFFGDLFRVAYGKPFEDEKAERRARRAERRRKQVRAVLPAVSGAGVGGATVDEFIVDGRRHFGGWLHKAGAHGRVWRKRFCVLTGRVLVYFAGAPARGDELTAQAAGVLVLTPDVTIVKSALDVRRPFVIEIRAGERVLQLAACHAVEQAHWLKLIREHADAAGPPGAGAAGAASAASAASGTQTSFDEDDETGEAPSDALPGAGRGVEAASSPVGESPPRSPRVRLGTSAKPATSAEPPSRTAPASPKPAPPSEASAGAASASSGTLPVVSAVSPALGLGWTPELRLTLSAQVNGVTDALKELVATLNLGDAFSVTSVLRDVLAALRTVTSSLGSAGEPTEDLLAVARALVADAKSLESAALDEAEACWERLRSDAKRLTLLVIHLARAANS